MNLLRFLCTVLFFLISAVHGRAGEPVGPIRFRIKLAENVAPEGSAGRLLVFMTNEMSLRGTIGTGFIPGTTHVAALEVARFPPGATLELTPDRLAFPEPFAKLKPGTYWVMALLDSNHSYNYAGEGPGDIKSKVEMLEGLDPANTHTIELTLSSIVPNLPPLTDSEGVKFIEFESPALSAFWGKSTTMHAAVAFPPGFDSGTGAEVPAVYHVPGYSATALSAWREAMGARQSMEAGTMPPMVHVFLDPSCPGGHHAFADSVNNGPWGTALTAELIPYLEKRFSLVANANARFLTGHSSGGWSTIWLQVNYPEYFGGTWSTSPDPVDLRNYTGINATPGSTDNAYREADGSVKQLVRQGKKWIASVEDFARQEEVVGEYGGQFASFEWVWSPRGPDGRPMPLFNRATGILNPAVLEAWQRYDVRRVLDTNWATLAPKLEGKLHLFCGAEDQFRLNESFELLQEFLKSKGSTAVCELIPGRTHSDIYAPHPLYPKGLNARFYAEMKAKFETGEFLDEAEAADPE